VISGDPHLGDIDDDADRRRAVVVADRPAPRVVVDPADRRRVGALVVLAGMRAGSDPGPGAIGVVVGIALLALVAVVATVLESRRIGRRFQRTIDELSRTQSEIRRLLDDLPTP
jgi:hypothetical protein